MKPMQNMPHAEDAGHESTFGARRAPLVKRLFVLRSLADLDSASPHWEIDIREMEQARFRELEIESLTAAKGRQHICSQDGTQ